MSVTHKQYGLAQDSAWSGLIDFPSGTCKALLLTTSYTPNQDTHQFRSDLTNEVAAGGGYSTGGVTIGSKTHVYTAGTNTLALSSSVAVTFTALTISFRYIAFYMDSGSPSTSPLISYGDTGSTQSPVAQDVVFSINAAGLWTFQVA